MYKEVANGIKAKTTATNGNACETRCLSHILPKYLQETNTLIKRIVAAPNTSLPVPSSLPQKTAKITAIQITDTASCSNLSRDINLSTAKTT